MREELVELAPPDDLDDVPAGAAEDRLELLDDLAVAAHRAVEPLQVAVDDEGQVVEALARRDRERAQRLRLVGLAVAQEAPHPTGRGVLDAALVQVAVEASLVDRGDRPEAHRDRRELPEIGHQARMRVGGQAAAGLDLVAEVIELILGQPALEEGAGVDARCGVALEEDLVAHAGSVLAAEEVVEADLVQRRRRWRMSPGGRRCPGRGCWRAGPSPPRSSGSCAGCAAPSARRPGTSGSCSGEMVLM